MTQPKIYIHAQDCLPIEKNGLSDDVLFYFSKEIQANTYHFANKKEEEPIIYFDYQKKCWVANRFIGECEFTYRKQVYVLKIRPRFGEEVLLKLFEYTYSTKLPPSYHQLGKSKGFDIHKLLISVIWSSLLQNALKFGLLRENKKIIESGTSIKGKLLIRESLNDIKLKNTVQYQYQTKTLNNLPNIILYKSYLVLKERYYLKPMFLSNTVRTEIEKIGQCCNNNSKISESDYKRIKYSSIYANYKPLIDLSWNIINSKELNIESSQHLGKNFFLDMAEVWEFFVLKSLTKNLIPNGWNLKNNSYQIYKSKFYSRSIIPDIVLEKHNKVLVVDAKYKRMNYQGYDIDRNDLFQIHTYSYFFDEGEKEITSALVYPLELERKTETNDNYLFSKVNHKNTFLIEGIEINSNNMVKNIEAFINALTVKIGFS